MVQYHQTAFAKRNGALLWNSTPLGIVSNNYSIFIDTDTYLIESIFPTLHMRAACLFPTYEPTKIPPVKNSKMGQRTKTVVPVG